MNPIQQLFKDNDFDTAMSKLTEQFDNATISEFIAEASYNAKHNNTKKFNDKFAEKFFIAACKYGIVPIIRRLKKYSFENNPNYNEIYFNGLLEAVKHNQIASVDELFHGGWGRNPDPTIHDNLILKTAYKNRNLNMIKKLLQNLRFDETEILEDYNERLANTHFDTIESLKLEDEETWNKVMNVKAQADRILDLSIAFKGSGLPPYVVADIIDWDRNRTSDAPTMSAFDVHQIVQHITPILQPKERVGMSENWVKRPKYALSTK